MSLAPRGFAFLVLVGLALAASGCGGNKDKLVGKWKLTSVTKDGKEQQMEVMGMTLLLEFTADGNLLFGMDLPAEFKEKMKDNSEAGQMKQVGKYKVSGDTLELTNTEKSGGDNPFGKKNKAKFKVEGDTLTLSSDDEGTAKLTRVK